MADIDAIATAIAGRFAAAQVTPPVYTGVVNIRTSTADIPNQLGPLPCVLVFSEDADMDHKVGVGSRFMLLHYIVRFYLDQTMDLERANSRLRKWATVLQDQLRISAQLGGTVNGWARIDGWRIGRLIYSDQPYVGIELRVSVTLTEGWAAVA